jgi:Secretion system C-terminal sorting domain
MKKIILILTIAGISQSIIAQRIYELYTAGGASASATWDADYIILSGFTANQNVAGWSLQNRSSGTTWTSTPLTGNADANGFFRFLTITSSSGNVPFTPQMSGNLIQFTNTGSGQVALFSPASGTTPATLTTAGTCPSGGQLVDLVGYIGTTSGVNSACFEGTGAAPATTGTQSRRRRTNININGIDTNNNTNDFELINSPYASTLPVRLISFTSKNTGNGNELTWKTSSEVNFSHYEVERSENAEAFEKIGKVDGNKLEVYEFIDKNPSYIINHSSIFYRLKMVDLDGTSAYSKIIVLKTENIDKSIGQIYPNPSYKEAKVSITTSESGNWSLKTFDNTGKLINKENIILQKGVNNVELKKLNSGMNYIKVSDGKTTEVRKVLKQ